MSASVNARISPRAIAAPIARRSNTAPLDVATRQPRDCAIAAVSSVDMLSATMIRRRSAGIVAPARRGDGVEEPRQEAGFVIGWNHERDSRHRRRVRAHVRILLRASRQPQLPHTVSGDAYVRAETDLPRRHSAGPREGRAVSPAESSRARPRACLESSPSIHRIKRRGDLILALTDQLIASNPTSPRARKKPPPGWTTIARLLRRHHLRASRRGPARARRSRIRPGRARMAQGCARLLRPRRGAATRRQRRRDPAVERVRACSSASGHVVTTIATRGC